MTVALLLFSYDEGLSKKDLANSDVFRIHLINFINSNGGKVGFSPVASTIYFYCDDMTNLVNHWHEKIRKEYVDTLRTGETFYYTLAKVDDDGFGNPDYISVEDEKLSDRFINILIPKADSLKGIDIKHLREVVSSNLGDQLLG